MAYRATNKSLWIQYKANHEGRRAKKERPAFPKWVFPKKTPPCLLLLTQSARAMQLNIPKEIGLEMRRDVSHTVVQPKNVNKQLTFENFQGSVWSLGLPMYS